MAFVCKKVVSYVCAVLTMVSTESVNLPTGAIVCVCRPAQWGYSLFFFWNRDVLSDFPPTLRGKFNSV